MQTWAIGDVHGCLTALNTLLAELQLKKEDQLIFLGDLIDRGPDSKGVIERVLELKKERTVHVIQGNHEEMLMIARDLPGYAQAWQQYGGKETLESYGWNKGIESGWIDALPETHWHFFMYELVDAVEEAGHIMVHGGIESTLPLKNQPWNKMRWKKWEDIAPHVSGQVVVCGHTAQVSGFPATIEHSICIDTWVYGPGWLTALELNSHEYVQANQQGEKRRAKL